MNKILTLITVLLVSFGAQAIEIPGEELERITLLAERIQANKTATWETFDLRSAPIVVTFDSGNLFAIGLGEQKGWEKFTIEGVEIQASNEDTLGVREFQMKPNHQIGEKQAFIYKMHLSNSSEEDVSILVHERFHRHQGEFFKQSFPQGASLDHLVLENLLWGEIEEEIIHDYLSGDRSLDLIRDFASVRSMRLRALDEKTKLWEETQIRMEGLADYVATKGGQGKRALAKKHKKKEREEIVDHAIKWRHYLVGAAMGYMLDDLQDAGWKEAVEGGDSLSRRLFHSLPLTDEEKEKRLQDIAKRVGFKKRKEKMQQRLDSAIKGIEAIHRMYEKEEGINLVLGRPKKGISGGGKNEKLLFIEDGAVVALNDTSLATTSDGSWTFETKSVNHLFQYADGFREVKLKEVNSFKVDAVELPISDFSDYPLEIPFHSLDIEGKEAVLHSKDNPGILVLEEGGVWIYYL